MSVRKAVYPGSFDPFTEGHCDIMCRAAKLFDVLYVAVLVNSNKKSAFDFSERKEMIEAVIREKKLDNVVVETSSGLLVDYVKKTGACCVVRGIRGAFEADSEFALEQANKHLDKNFETVYLAAEPSKRHISSSMAREIASYNGNLQGIVPDTIKNMIAERLNNYE